MKDVHNTLTCLFGHHDYSKRLTKDKNGFYMHLCKICKKSGHRKWGGDGEVWFEYDERGNRIHEKWDDGDEAWYDHNKEGECVHEKWGDGEERWYNENGTIIHKQCSDGYEVWFDKNGSIIRSDEQKN